LSETGKERRFECDEDDLAALAAERDFKKIRTQANEKYSITRSIAASRRCNHGLEKPEKVA
jgi:hypothetical protein